MSMWDTPGYDFKRVYSPSELKQLIESQPLAFETPGSSYYYSNSGYIILGEVIARLDGQSLDQSLRQNVFNVAGLTRIDHLNDTIMPSNGAQPYYFLSSKDYIRLNETVGPRASAAGGWITTAPELMRFIQCYISNCLIASETKSIQQSANNSFNPATTGTHYGYGIVTMTNTLVRNRSIIGHNGSGAGFSIDVFYEPVSQFSVVMCSNMYGSSFEIMGNYFNLLLGEKLVKVQPSGLVRFVDYVLARNQTADISDFFKKNGLEPRVELFINATENLMRIKKLTEANVVLQKAEELFPANAIVLVFKGDLAFAKQDILLARGLYQKARDMALQNRDAMAESIAQSRLDKLK